MTNGVGVIVFLHKSPTRYLRSFTCMGTLQRYIGSANQKSVYAEDISLERIQLFMIKNVMRKRM